MERERERVRTLRPRLKEIQDEYAEDCAGQARAVSEFYIAKEMSPFRSWRWVVVRQLVVLFWLDLPPVLVGPLPWHDPS